MSDETRIEYDIGFSILANGDVVTSDGLPRGSFDVESWPEIFGKPLSFRRPTPAERKELEQYRTGLDKAFEQFREVTEQKRKPMRVEDSPLFWPRPWVSKNG